MSGVLAAPGLEIVGGARRAGRLHDVSAVVVDAEEVERLRRSRMSPGVEGGSSDPKLLEDRTGTPRASTGSRNQRFASASAGARRGVLLRLRQRVHRDQVEPIPTCAPGARGASTWAARPCARRRWWAAGTARPRSPCPERAPRARSRARPTHGSFRAIQRRTRSPRRAATTRVLRERLDRLTRRPAPGILERLGEIPVVERDERLDAVREQLVDEPVVEVEARLVHAPRPSGRMRGHAIEKR